MKILLLRATGRTGKLVLQEALKKGCDVNCLVRHTSKIKYQYPLTIYEGKVNRVC